MRTLIFAAVLALVGLQAGAATVTKSFSFFWGDESRGGFSHEASFTLPDEPFARIVKIYITATADVTAFLYGNGNGDAGIYCGNSSFFLVFAEASGDTDGSEFCRYVDEWEAMTNEHGGYLADDSEILTISLRAKVNVKSLPELLLLNKEAIACCNIYGKTFGTITYVGSLSAVPVPASSALLLSGILILFLRRRVLSRN